MMTKINDKMLEVFVKMQTLMLREEGQDLIEYALLVALIAFAATAGMKTLATDINAAFTGIGSTLVTYTSTV
ncbi:MAG: Flp family type IVb pilin [Acidobacteriaceae bacterium]